MLFLFQVEANWHPFPIGQQLADQFLCMVDTCNRNSSYKEDSSVKSKLPKDLISLFSFCWLIFRLGGTGLGFTEEVEDVGDLHRGEFLAVLAVTGGGELLEKVGDALDPSHQVSTGYCWSSIGKYRRASSCLV